MELDFITSNCIARFVSRAHKRGVWRFLLYLINGGGQNKWAWNFKKSVNIGNEWKKRHKCLTLMLSLKVSKQTRSEACKNKVIINRVSNISINLVNLSK